LIGSRHIHVKANEQPDKAVEKIRNEEEKGKVLLARGAHRSKVRA